MKRIEKNKGSTLVSSGREQRRLQSSYIKLVRDGTKNATGYDEYVLQVVPPSGPSSQAIPPVPLLKTLVRYPNHRVRGTFGEMCTLETNHFVVSPPEYGVYKYDVYIFPKDTSSGVNRAVMAELVSMYRQSDLNGRLPAYDGRKHLYTAAPLPYFSRTFKIKLQSDGQAQRRSRQFKVVIKFVAHVGFAPSGMNLTVEQECENQVALQALDIILREIFIERSCPIAEPLQLGEGLEIRHGFCKSLQFTQIGILLNIDVSSTVLMKPMMDYIALLLDRSSLDGPLCDGDLTKVLLFLWLDKEGS